MTVSSTPDHLVIVADTLEQGARWCEARLGITPGPGGKHPLMGTHNRLLRLATPAFPQAYLEIIAIDPQAPPPARKRWFDMDDAVLQRAVKDEPRLVHFVAGTADAAFSLKRLAQAGIDRGELVAAQRAVDGGLLRWQISVRHDGQRLFYGMLPTLIEWSGPHPTGRMPDPGLRLQSLTAHHPRELALREAHAAIGLQGVDVQPGPPNLVAVIDTPRGPVTLESLGT